MARLLEIPAFSLVKGDQKIAKFDGYDELYSYARKEKEKIPELLGMVTGDPYIVMRFGEIPLKYDLETGELYELCWHEVLRCYREPAKPPEPDPTQVEAQKRWCEAASKVPFEKEADRQTP